MPLFVQNKTGVPIRLTVDRVPQKGEEHYIFTFSRDRLAGRHSQEMILAVPMPRIIPGLVVQNGFAIATRNPLHLQIAQTQQGADVTFILTGFLN